MLFTWYGWLLILAFLLNLYCFGSSLDASFVIEEYDESRPYGHWKHTVKSQNKVQTYQFLD